MSFTRQPGLSRADERFLVLRASVVRCAPGTRVPGFGTRWHQLVLAVRGVILVRTPVGAWSTPSISAVWVPALTRIELETSAQTTLRTLHVRPTAAPRAPDAPRVVRVSPLLRELGARAESVRYLDRRKPAHLALFRLMLDEIRQGADRPQELAFPRDPRAAPIAAALEADPADPRTLDELCKGRGASPRTIQRLFPLETGLTFERWRARLRHLHAVRLLGEGASVTRVAAACGYSSPSAFVAAFRQTAGITPGRSRRDALTPP